MTEDKPAPRQRTRTTPPAARVAPPEVTPAPARTRQRATPPRQVEEAHELPAYHPSEGRSPRRAGAIGMEWHEVAGTEFDLFVTRATSPYSYGGVAVGSPGGGELRGFYYKHAERSRIAIYILTGRGNMEFVRWMTGSSVEAMQAVSAAWLARKGLRARAA